MTRPSVLRFPATHPDWSWDYDKKTDEIVIRLQRGGDIAAHVCQALTWLTEFTGHVLRHQDWAERDLRTEAVILEQRKRHIDVARAYQRLRLNGVKHRAAIRSLFVDPSFSDLHASTADLAYWVKIYSLERCR